MTFGIIPESDSKGSIRKGLQRAPTNTMLFSDYHLAKLNPKCHMNYLDYL